MLIACDAETYLRYIEDDPVRPDLFEDNRVRFEGNFHVFADVDINEETGEEIVNAILCAVITPFVLRQEADLQEIVTESGTLNEFQEALSEIAGEDGLASILTPYSLWSYKKGAGKRLINTLLTTIPIQFPEVTHVITMSPPTKMAMNFHISNGAVLLSPNVETINYEYRLEDSEDVTLH
jgi:hypothetical protein